MKCFWRKNKAGQKTEDREFPIRGSSPWSFMEEIYTEKRGKGEDEKWQQM